ncbi:thermonuclease family protein [Candidatus Palauibacter sp.]|uniref:thermonuclease family protein n=1 Tax=Candidatus Palauibacter sp. TaxID=3101350 RepID=UPI003B0146D0
MSTNRTKEYVTNVLDGDTFETSSSLPDVRLEGVDTPEQGEPGYLEAKAALKRLILDRFVDIETKARDIYGRRVAQVWVDGRSVNQAMKRYSKQPV